MQPVLVLIAAFVLSTLGYFDKATDSAKYFALVVIAITGILTTVNQYAAIREGESICEELSKVAKTGPLAKKIAGFKGQYELNTLIKHYSKRGDANQVYRYIFRNIDDISPSNLNEIRQQFKAFANTPGALAKIAEIKEISNGLTLSPLLSGADWNFKAHPTVNALIRSGYVEFTDFIFKNQNFLTNYLKSDGVDSIMDTARRGNLEFISSMFMSIPDNSHDNARKLLDIALEGFIDGNQRGKITQLFERLDLNRVSIDGVETQEILSTWLVYARTSRLNEMWNEINNIIRSQNLN